MKQKKNSKSLKVICATSAVIFSLFTCFTGVFAWFYTNAQSKTQSGQIEVKANPNLIDLSFTVYKYDAESKQGKKYVEGDPDFDLSLNKFDNFIRERNVNSNNVMRFVLSFPNRFSEQTKRDVFFSITCDSSETGTTFDPGIIDTKERKHKDNNGYKYTCESVDYVCNNISNVVYFKVLPYTYTINGVSHKFDESINIDETNDSNTYFDATNYFQTQSTKSMFVNNGTKATEIDIDIEAIVGNADNIVLYVEYNYDTNLIDEFLKPNEFCEKTTTSEFFGVNIDFFKDVLVFELTSKGENNE